TLPQDPDHVLVRVLHDSSTVGPPDGQGEVVYTLPGYLNFVQDQAGRYPVLQRAGVDRVAVAAPGFVFRTADPTAAQRFVTDSATLGDPATRLPLDPPDGVPGSICLRDTTAPTEAQFRCFASHGRYASLTLGPRLWETQQRTAAQYALLANSA
ncbi:DUF7373 family lipoprotein, partial [Nocardia gipuzkoensis]